MNAFSFSSLVSITFIIFFFGILHVAPSNANDLQRENDNINEETTDSTTSSSSPITTKDPTVDLTASLPRFIIISQGETGGMGIQYAAMSRLCYSGMYLNHVARTYNDGEHEDSDPLNPDKSYYDISIANGSTSNMINSATLERKFSDEYQIPKGEVKKSFAKVALMKRAIAEYKLTPRDWVIWMDRDTYIVDPSRILGEVLMQDVQDCEFGDQTTSKENLADGDSSLPHLVVGAGNETGKLLSTRFLAMRATKWTSRFLDSWLRDLQKVVFGSENGPFLNAVLRALIAESPSSSSSSSSSSKKSKKKYKDECSVFKLHKHELQNAMLLPNATDEIFWKQDFVTPFLKCYNKQLEAANLIISPSSDDENNNVSSSFSVSCSEVKNIWIPASSRKIRFECLLSDRPKFNKEPWSWINQGDLESYKKWAVDIGERFDPRCF